MVIKYKTYAMSQLVLSILRYHVSAQKYWPISLIYIYGIHIRVEYSIPYNVTCQVSSSVNEVLYN